jgi:hypothetical protein
MIYECMKAVRPLPNPTPIEPFSATLVVSINRFLDIFMAKNGKRPGVIAVLLPWCFGVVSCVICATTPSHVQLDLISTRLHHIAALT